MKDSWVIAKGILMAVGIIAVLNGVIRFAVESSKPDPLTEATDQYVRDMSKAMCKINPKAEDCKE